MRTTLAVLVALVLLPVAAEAQQQPTQPGWPQPVHNDRLFDYGVLGQDELRTGDGSRTYRWDGEAWYGNDLNRAWLRSEGNLDTETSTFDEAEVQVLYSRAITGFFDLQGGARWDVEPNPSRGWAMVGLEGLAPLYLEVGVFAFVRDGGHAAGRLEASCNLPLSQRLVLQPQIELNAYSRSDPATGTGAGLSDLDTGLRLRYQIRRQIAPYLGLTYENQFGSTADFSCRVGDPVRRLRLAAGIRLWH